MVLNLRDSKKLIWTFNCCVTLLDSLTTIDSRPHLFAVTLQRSATQAQQLSEYLQFVDCSIFSEFPLQN